MKKIIVIILILSAIIVTLTMSITKKPKYTLVNNTSKYLDRIYILQERFSATIGYIAPKSSIEIVGKPDFTKSITYKVLLKNDPNVITKDEDAIITLHNPINTDKEFKNVLLTINSDGKVETKISYKK